VIRDVVAYRFQDTGADRVDYDDTRLFLANSNSDIDGVGVVQAMPNGEFLTSAWQCTREEGWLQLEDGPGTDGAILIGHTMSRLFAMSAIAEYWLTHPAPVEVQ
jgi:hypothetical protein